jgi:hypothetical protein
MKRKSLDSETFVACKTLAAEASVTTKIEVDPPASRDQSPAGRPVRGLSAPDYWLLAFGACLIYAIMARSSLGRLFWEDEVLGWMLLTDPSWHHMILSWQSGADGGGFSFYLTGRLWLAVFGHSMLSFRMYSASGFAVALCLLWWSARRFYSVRTVTFAALVTIFLSPVLIPHIAEGRFYGLFFAATALVIASIVACESVDKPGVIWTACVFGANSLLVTTHILGICYSGVLLLALILIDRLRGRNRMRLYAATIASWLWLIPSKSAILSSAAVGRPHFWTEPANLKTFLLAYAGSSLRTAVIGVVLILIALMHARKRDNTLRIQAKERLPILLIAGALFVVPVVFACESMVGPSLFNGRYMEPVEAAVMFAICELSTHVSDALLSFLRAKPVEVLAWSGLVLMVLHYDLMYLPRYSAPHADYSSALTAQLPPNVPIVCEDAFTFTELMGRQADSRVRFMYLLDWQQSVSPSAPKLEVTQYHLMENWRRVGYFADHIAYRSKFLEEQPYFIVLHTQERNQASLLQGGSASIRKGFIGNPLTDRFAEDSSYSTVRFADQDLGQLRESETLVCRRGMDCGALSVKLKNAVLNRQR